MVEKDNLLHIADAKKRKVSIRVDCEADNRDSGREIFKKRGHLKKKIINPPITISLSEILLQMKRPLTQEKPYDATEANVFQFKEKIPPFNCINRLYLLVLQLSRNL